MFGSEEPGIAKKAPTDLLNDFRNLIRKELDFGKPITLNRDRAWFGKVAFEPEEE